MIIINFLLDIIQVLNSILGFAYAIYVYKFGNIQFHAWRLIKTYLVRHSYSSDMFKNSVRHFEYKGIHPVDFDFLIIICFYSITIFFVVIIYSLDFRTTCIWLYERNIKREHNFSIFQQSSVSFFWLLINLLQIIVFIVFHCPFLPTVL